MSWELLEKLKFWSSKIDTENTMLDLYFNEENGYSEENTSDKEDFTIHQPFQKKSVVMRAMRNKL